MNSDPFQSYRPFPVRAPQYHRLVQDYAGAWTAERGPCHRFVYTEDDGRPTNCPKPPVRSGWRRDGQGRWYVVDACAEHASQLLDRRDPAPVGS